MKLYRTIVADPPWPFQWSGGKGGRRRRETELGYKTMTVEEICALGDWVKTLVDPTGCNLFLWVTDEMLAEGNGMKVARAWGFVRSGPSIVWRKPNFGTGLFPRPQHEQILVCRLPKTKNTWLPGANRIGSVHDWKQDYSLNGGKRHSRKPEGFLDLVKRVSPPPHLEMFARRNRLDEWDTWGNEAMNHVDKEAVNG